jgi:hypothetical protein
LYKYENLIQNHRWMRYKCISLHLFLPQGYSTNTNNSLRSSFHQTSFPYPHRYPNDSSSSSYPFPTLSGVGTICFSSCCDKDSAIIFTTRRLPDVKPPWNWSGLTTANAAGTNGLTCLPKHGDILILSYILMIHLIFSLFYT